MAAVLSKRKMTEEDIKLQFITPAITKKWALSLITMETRITDGQINLRGNMVSRKEAKKADYILYLNESTPIAIVEAKDNKHAVGDGLQQAMQYAIMMDIPFAYSSNGDGFMEHDFLTGEERSISMEDFPAPDALYARFKAGANHGEGLTQQEESIIRQPFYSGQNTYPPRYYQRNAVNRTLDAIARGQDRILLVMATGTGKTYTGLGAISKLSEDLNDDLAVIIVAPYKHLVEQWVEDIVKFNMKPIIAYGDPAHKDWRKKFSKAITDQKIRRDKRFLCVVTTNVTFASPDFQERIDKIKSPILLVVDEAHNFGARSYAKHLDDRFAYRLALSATLERHRDDEGTALLYSFFGKKCIEYPLERAIDEDKLTPYKYYPILVYLSELELESYEQLSYEMSKCMIKDKHGKYKLSKRGEILALKRSRVVAGAMQKLEALKREITPYKDDNNILVYCGATRVIDDSDTSSDDESDIRQIEAVTKILGNELNMNVARFTSEENMEERALIKEHFQDGGKLQAIVAIKCLDEGVNIPGIRTAFILASTTNPKEYIQRRGRVLRKAANKPFAEIYDFVTLPRPLDSVSGLTIEQANRDKTLVKNELARIKEFGRLALNSMLANNLIWDIQEAYHLNETDLEKEGEDFE